MAERRQSRGFVPSLVIMAKSPVAGRAKRRLAREIGTTEALRFYRACLANGCLRLAASRRWRTLIAVTPDRDLTASFWPRGIERIAQGKGDLGARMQRIFRSLSPGPTMVVGSDVPGIKLEHIAGAVRLLGRADAVLGPAPDGGYWLIGLQRNPTFADLFAGVRWSSPHALADTLAAFRGKRVAFAPMLTDVDTQADYRGQRTFAARLVLPAGNKACS